MVKYLLPLIPDHHTYVEVFGGGAQLLFAKNPSKVDVYNDIDTNLYSLFKVVKDSRCISKFIKYIQLTPYSREEFRDSVAIVKDNCGDLSIFSRAVAFFIVCKMGFSSTVKGWSASRSKMDAWKSTIRDISACHKRLSGVHIENKDFGYILKKYDGVGTLFYCDPPYVGDTRPNARSVYRYEMNNKEHKKLIDILLKLKGMVILSGRLCPLYNKLEMSRWNRMDFDMIQFASKSENGTNRKTVIESIWINHTLESKLNRDII